MNDWQNQTGGSPSPSSQVTAPPAPAGQTEAKPKSTAKFCLMACGGCVVLILLVVIVGFVWGFFMVKGAVKQVETSSSQEPSIQQHLGDVESVWPNLQKTGEADNTGQVKPGTIVCDISGTKAEGELYVETMIDSQGQARLVPVQLILSTGENIPLLAPLKVELPKNPLVQQSLGDIESIQPDAEKTKRAGPGVIVCTVVGTAIENDAKVQGDLYIKQMVDSQGQPRLIPSKITLPNDKGEEKVISFEAGAANQPFGF